MCPATAMLPALQQLDLHGVSDESTVWRIIGRISSLERLSYSFATATSHQSSKPFFTPEHVDQLLKLPALQYLYLSDALVLADSYIRLLDFNRRVPAHAPPPSIWLFCCTNEVDSSAAFNTFQANYKGVLKLEFY